MKLKYIITLIASVILISCGVQSSTLPYYDQKPQILRSELDGSYIIRTMGKGNSTASALEEAKKNALYDIIFNGISSSSSRTSSLKPLLLEVNAKEKYNDYFNVFFADGGDYKQYVSQQSKPSGSKTFTKNKLQVLCHTNVVVNLPALKEKLIADKILKK